MEKAPDSKPKVSHEESQSLIARMKKHLAENKLFLELSRKFMAEEKEKRDRKEGK